MSLKNKIYETATNLHSSLFNPLSTSKFLQEGVVTPDEFVQAGDLLVAKFPSWSWQENSKTTQKGLPKEKQFLLLRNAPCRMRISAFEAKSISSENEDIKMDFLSSKSETNSNSNSNDDLGLNGWLRTHINEKTENEDIPEIPGTGKTNKEEEGDSDEDAPEINLDDLSIKDNITMEDPATLKINTQIIKTRTYDISICYDQYNQTPRVWLFGYDENKNPLKPDQVLEDISQDHVNKTVTIATHPHTGISQAYIHPCRHAAVMKRIIQRMLESSRTPRIDQYLLIFLKFIHAAIPTIEYDFTTDMEI